MERDHGRGLKQQPAWAPGHNFSLAGCFSWPAPPSSAYTCGYCRREFRSAQALGGHMNVHRRDRARLRQCCSAYAAASLPGPNLVVAAHHHGAASPLPNLNLLPLHCAGAGAATAEPVVYSFFATSTAAKKKAAVEVNFLDLGIGGVRGRGGGAAEDGGLDLELRLGGSWE